MHPPRIEGQADNRFKAVEEAFRANFEDRGELGAAVAVYLEGRKVVDLWGGLSDPGTQKPWRGDTLQLVFSTTKGLVALCIAMLVDRGVIGYDKPIADYWPEFAQQGKEEITVRQLLNHQAGLTVIEEPMTLATLADLDVLAGFLARQRPMWEPGTAIGYHALTLGWYAGELVRRCTGRTVGRFFADEVAGPLSVDCYIGLQAALEPRVSTTVPAPKDPALAEVDPLARALADTHSLSYRSFVNPEDLMTDLASFNLPEVHALEVPAANGICTARGLARIYSVLATRGEGDGVHLLGGQVLEEAQREQAKGMDLVTHWPQCYSVGFMKPYGAHPYSIHPESFGHPGAGGSVAFSDPVSGLGFAYVMNRMGPYSRLDPRAESLIAALYASV